MLCPGGIRGEAVGVGQGSVDLQAQGESLQWLLYWNG